MARFITHILVRVPPGTREEQDLHYPVANLGLPARLDDWTFDHIVSAFTLESGPARYRGVAVVQLPWLRSSVMAGRQLLDDDDYGGWLVRYIQHLLVSDG